MKRQPGLSFDARSEPVVRNIPVGAIKETSKEAGRSEVGGSLSSLWKSPMWYLNLIS